MVYNKHFKIKDKSFYIDDLLTFDVVKAILENKQKQLNEYI